jgi:hypothetical protein
MRKSLHSELQPDGTLWHSAASFLQVLYASNMTAPVPIESAWDWASGDDADAAAAAVTKTSSSGPQRWVKVPHAAPLLLPLVARDYVVPDIPVSKREVAALSVRFYVTFVAAVLVSLAGVVRCAAA